MLPKYLPNFVRCTLLNTVLGGYYVGLYSLGASHLWETILVITTIYAFILPLFLGCTLSCLEREPNLLKYNIFHSSLQGSKLCRSERNIKGTVSQQLRRVLQYINGKLFSRAIVGHHKILILLKEHFKINKRRSSYERPYNSRWSAQF